MKKSISIPQEGTGTRAVYDALSDQWAPRTEINRQAIAIKPDIRLKSTAQYLNDLIKKNLVEKKKELGHTYFRLTSEATKTSPQRTTNRTDNIFYYLKPRIGQFLSAFSLKHQFSPDSTAAYDILRRFATYGLVQKEKRAGVTGYLVLSTINQFDHTPTKTDIAKLNEHPTQQELITDVEVIETDSNVLPDISNMSLGELLNSVIKLRDENLKLKNTLESIAQQLSQIGIIELEGGN